MLGGDAQTLSKLRDDFRSAFSTVLSLVILILLFTYFLSMALGPFLVYWLPQGVEASSKTIDALPLSLFMFASFAIPIRIDVGILFLGLWILYIGAFVLAWFEEPRFDTSLRTLSVRSFAVKDSNYLVLLPQIASMILFLVVAVQALQESAGVQTGGISFENPILGFLSVAYAPLVEELSFRISTMGVLDGIYLIFRTRQRSHDRERPSAWRLLLLTIWNPEKAKEALDLGTIRKDGVMKGISRFEWSMLAATSLMFGAAHYLSGAGWEIGKISTALLSGFVLGFVYLRYGAYAPILLHWFFNYYFGVFDLTSELKLSGFDFLAFGVEFLNLGVGALLALALAVTCLARVLSIKHYGNQIA